MTAPTRIAGWGRLDDGATVTWTVAEGRRGRRWREVVTHGPSTRHALLLETGPDGRFSHLELARADGLWTFHPEPDGTLHGNRVGQGVAGVRHVAGWPFATDDALLIEGSPISLASVAWYLGPGLDDGDKALVQGVVIRADGDLVRLPSIAVERLSATRWRVGQGSAFDIDQEGLPVLDGGQTWPLEED